MKSVVFILLMLCAVQAFDFDETFELRTCADEDVQDYWHAYEWGPDLRMWCRFDCNPDCSLAIINKDKQYWFPKYEFKGITAMQGVCNPKNVGIHYGIAPDRSTKYMPVCRLFSDELMPAYTLNFIDHKGAYVLIEQSPIEVAFRDAIMISDYVAFNDISKNKKLYELYLSLAPMSERPKGNA